MEIIFMKIKNNKKIIGILGGMGPQASAYLLKMIIDLSVDKFGSENDDFPEILLDSIPVPDFISSDARKKEALKMLKNRVKLLNNINPSCLIIACNTAHIFLNDLQKISKTPFISMIEEVARVIAMTSLKRVGIMGSSTTIKSELYQRALCRFDIKCIQPKSNELIILERIIRNVIGESSNNDDKRMLLLVANNLRKRGAQGIILGCTELPLVFPRKYDLPVYNSVEILAMASLQKYYKQNTI